MILQILLLYFTWNLGSLLENLFCLKNNANILDANSFSTLKWIKMKRSVYIKRCVHFMHSLMTYLYLNQSVNGNLNVL